MKIICRKIISATTKKDLGESSPWLKIGKEYNVLAINLIEELGIEIFIQTEHFDEPKFFDIDGFEFIDQSIPSSWITKIGQVYHRKVMTMLPKSWNYESFFEDLGDENPDAMKLFTQEAELIYREAGLIK
ncbi:MAG TPA: hypothetical protein VGH95_02775 [Candidatus Aquirickettsiella sp.]|jgi:hypothetical protein